MSRKAYIKPAVQVVKIHQQVSLLAGSPDTYNQVGQQGVQFSRGGGSWDEDEE